ncbi:MAG: glycosyltransferase [Chthonomonas sp.]|nr:glycosyltransferase [Chthonomonas sp.]
MSLIHAAIICSDDVTYLGAVMAALDGIPVTVFVSRVPHSRVAAGDWELAASKATALGAEVIFGDWPDEQSHRRATLDWARSKAIPYLLIPDTDEVISKQLMESLRKVAEVGLADCVYCAMDTYWKSPEHVIRPPERLMPPIMLAPASVDHIYLRQFSCSRPLMLSAEHGVMHHLSYSGPDSRIRRKTSTWAHKDEVLPHWTREVWEPWDRDRSMRNLHPTHPGAYGSTERIHVPAELQLAWEEYLSACGGADPLRAVEQEPAQMRTKVSVIIPLYGGPEDLRLCLESLEQCTGEIHEVIVVDDASPDDAASVVQEFAFAKLVQNPENLGFGATCNRGARVAKGDALLFLNSDTIVPPGSIRLLAQSLERSGTIGAAGPVSNNVGHFQHVDVTYTSLATMPLFAEDLRATNHPDQDCDMLTGFCLMIPRKVWDEIGEFDERFRVGMFEDNDYCHRLRREGYRLVYSRRAFVHHKGNASLDRHSEDKQQVFALNEARYYDKWRWDLELGFASNLAGITPERIQFREDRRPETLVAGLAEQVRQANISLCMIVRDEERVLDSCLSSAKPFFTQIVIVDTGSTDRTIEIARSHGATVFESTWPESFALARNESLSHATGDWVCWLDADDTLPFASGTAMLSAVLGAPPGLGGLVMSVRFVNDDPQFGTTVDHVKVFRNHQGFAFEGRIHEQILPSIREKGLDVARIDAEVLHTGYDTSEVGQAKKRRRDDTLLKLDLADRPDHPFVLFNLGMTAHYNGEHQEACEWLQRSISVATQEESHIRKAYALWAVSTRELGDREEALRIVELGLAQVPADPELLFHKGLLLSGMDRLAEAAAAYEQVLSAPRGSHFSSADSGIFGYKTLHNLAGVYQRIGDLMAARSAYERAIESNPRHLHSTFDLFRLALQMKDFALAQRCIAHVRHIEGESSNFEQMRAELFGSLSG